MKLSEPTRRLALALGIAFAFGLAFGLFVGLVVDSGYADPTPASRYLLQSTALVAGVVGGLIIFPLVSGLSWRIVVERRILDSEIGCLLTGLAPFVGAVLGLVLGSTHF